MDYITEAFSSLEKFNTTSKKQIENNNKQINNQGDKKMKEYNMINENITDNSLQENTEKSIEKKPHRKGTIEYEANEGRKNRIAYYKKIMNLDEDAQLTEDNLKPWAVNRVACFTNTPVERVRDELLGTKWSEFEED